jgi:hypothetical protein
MKIGIDLACHPISYYHHITTLSFSCKYDSKVRRVAMLWLSDKRNKFRKENFKIF